MAATWVPVWRVSPEGDRLTPYEASVTASSVTVRRPGQPSGRCRVWYFKENYGDTPAQAIEKFLLQQRQEIDNARQEIARADQRIEAALILRDEQVETR